MMNCFFVLTAVGKWGAVSCLPLLNTAVRDAPGFEKDTSGTGSCASLTKSLTNISCFFYRLTMLKGSEKQSYAVPLGEFCNASILITSGMYIIGLCDSGLEGGK